MNEMLVPIVESRRDGTGSDLISMIWRDAPELFGADYEDDAMSLAQVAFESAAQTTQYSTANGLYLLLTEPGLQDQLRSGDQRALANFVEESLRLYGPVLFRLRFPKRDLELGGVPVRRGDRVICVTISGSRDPHQHVCPAGVDLDRPRPRQHLSFWVGPKTCPGNALARAELVEAVAAVLDRLGDLRLDPDAEPPRYDELVFRRWAPLHALWSPL
jgi:cytochrome P450